MRPVSDVGHISAATRDGTPDVRLAFAEIRPSSLSYKSGGRS